MSERFDAVVIGGSASGLAAVALLAKAGLKALLVERNAAIGAATGEHTVRALDPRVVKELKLARHGLKFAVRDLPLVALKPGSAPLVLGGDRYAAARSLAAQSPADAGAFATYHDELFTLARTLRRIWWDGRPAAETLAPLRVPQRDLFARLCVTSAAAFLAARFESDALKAALAFDAACVGISPGEAGSALALLWCAAQEMSGLQGAVAWPRGGPQGLVQALSSAAQGAGAEIRTGATVSSVTVSGDRATGVELVTGEHVEAPLVLSSLSRHRTLADLLTRGLAGLGRMSAPLPPNGIGSATLVFGLNRLPVFGGLTSPHRYVIAERVETYAAAFTAARLGQMPDEPAIELIMPPAESTTTQFASRLQLSARVWPLPLDTLSRDALSARVIALIDRQAPGFASAVPSCDLLPLEEHEPVTVERLTAGAAARSETPVRGLFLCGRTAEPAEALSCRAARHAVHMALALHRDGGAR